MIWLTWRQFRAQAAAVAAVAVAFALVLAATGPRLADTPLPTATSSTTSRGPTATFQAAIVVVAVAPAIIGVFWGAPLGRPRARGRHPPAGLDPVRHPHPVAGDQARRDDSRAAAAVGLLTFAVTWWSQPLDGALSSTHGSLPSRITPVTFAMRGVVPVGYAVFARRARRNPGAVFRRSLPAMAVTLGRGHLRADRGPDLICPHLAPTTEQTVAFNRERLDGISIGDTGPGSPLRMTVNTGAGQLGAVQRDHRCQRAGRAPCPRGSRTASRGRRPRGPPGTGREAQGPETLDACFTRLNAEGYRQHLVYQPASTSGRCSGPSWRCSSPSPACSPGSASGGVAGLP